MRPQKQRKDGYLILNQPAAGGNRPVAARLIVYIETGCLNDCIVSNLGVNFGFHTLAFHLIEVFDYKNKPKTQQP